METINKNIENLLNKNFAPTKCDIEKSNTNVLNNIVW